MGDAGVREAERRWRASGSAEDRAEWLRLRVRAGALTAGQVERAGYAGDAAARLAAGLPGDWLDALAALDRRAPDHEALRVALAHALALLCVDHAPGDDERSRGAERAALDVVADPRPERRTLPEDDLRVLLGPDVARKRGHALPTWAARVALHLALGVEEATAVGGEDDPFALPASPLFELAKVARRLAPREAIDAACAALAAAQLGDA